MDDETPYPVVLTFELRHAEHVRWMQLAAAAGLTLTEWAERNLRAIVRQVDDDS